MDPKSEKTIVVYLNHLPEEDEEKHKICDPG